MYLKILLFLSLTTFFLTPFESKSQVSTQDSLALVDLYDSTDGLGWTNSTNWLTTAPVSTWYGVTVDTARVSALDLGNNNLIGALPSSLGNFSALTSLVLFGNNLSGSIPPSISNLRNLIVIQISDAHLTGEIPSSFGNLTNLEQVFLASNQLSGSLPASLSNLTHLRVLFLGDNQFTGTIPASLGNLSNLIWLYLQLNKFTGEIPSALGNLTNLRILFLSGNQLTGAIPSSFSNLVNLQMFGVEINKLSGDLPDFLGNILGLTDLYLDDNQFTGQIPSSFRNFFGLMKLLTLENNKFTFAGMESVAHTFGDAIARYSPQAAIPIIKNGNIFSVSAGGTLSNNTYSWYKNDTLIARNTGDSTLTVTSPSDYYYVTVSNSIATQLTLNSIDSSAIRDSLALVDLYNSTNGPSWTINTNWLTKAPLNSWYGVNILNQDSTRVIDLNLSSNNLSGKIPYSLGRLRRLKSFDLSGNKLSDTIPASLGNFTNVWYFSLLNNQLSGKIPASFGNFSKVAFLMLFGNHLTGELPAELGNLSSANYLALNDNNLTGSIPTSFGKLSSLNSLSLNNNKLSGNIPLSLDSLPSLMYDMNIANNQFTFNGMEPLASAYSFASYAPQATIRVNKNGSQLSVSAGGTPANDTFMLYKDGNLQKKQIADSIFTIGSPGKYSITVSNSIATQLTLYSDTLTINTDSLILPAHPNTEYASYEYTDTAGWTHYYYNNNTPNDLTDDTLLLSLKKNGQNIGAIGDGTFAVKLVATAGAGSNTAINLTNPLITNSSGYWVMNRYWQVTPTHEPGESVGVRFYYNNKDLADVNGSYPNHNLTNEKLIFYKTVGGNPDPTTNLAGATAIISIMPGTKATDTTWTYHALSDTTQYGEYSVASFSGGGGGGTGNNQALPVVLVNFMGNLAKNDVQLNWQTAQEINAGYYTVERSLTGRDYTAVGRINAAGNSTITQAYKLTDYNAALLGSTTLYYRLKITDKNGYATYSKGIAVNIAGAISGLLVYPNPAKNTATVIFYANAVGKYAIEVTDLEGRIIKRLESRSSVGINKVLVNVQGYSQGSYMVTVVGDNIKQQSVTLMKQ